MSDFITNAELRIESERLCDENERLEAENAELRHDLEEANNQAEEVCIENAKLREQMERLVTLLRVDCDIDASWDGLRRFWSIELTEGGCLMRDRACKAEADNAKLRELVSDFWTDMNTCHLNGDVPNERDLDFYRPRVHEFGITDISERELRVDVG